MPMPTVEHIRDVSFKDHFLSTQEAAPKNGSIQVNHNTFDVTFVDGKVNAKFASGNWFTNFFRSSTLTRFTQTLQAQYDSWVNDQAKADGGGGFPGVVVNAIVVDDNVQEPPVMELLPNDPNDADENAGNDEGVKGNPNVVADNKAQGMPEAKDIQNNPNVAAENAGINEGGKANPNVAVDNKAQGVPAAKGFQNNPNVAAVNTAIDGIIDVLHANYDKIDKDGLRYSKAVMKAFAMPDAAASLSEDDAASYERAVVGEFMPKNMAKLLSKLGEIGKLAALRNQLTNVPSGRECDEIVRNAGFLTHTLENNIGKSEQEIKRYVLNMLDTVIDGFLAAVNGMTDKNTQALDFLRKFDGACVEAKGDNVQEYMQRAMNIASAGRSEQKHDLAYSVTAEFAALAEKVRTPFLDAARKECEAEVRAWCAKKDITDEAEIQERITGTAETKLAAKSDEIEELVKNKLQTEGKSFLYENLCGALRPVTTVEKDSKTGQWTVTMLLDKKGDPIMKPVSALDIDKNFDKFVEMFMKDAHAMGLVENKTHTASGKVSFATKQDLCATGVLKAADFYAKGSAEDFAELVKAVKKDLRPGLDIPDDKLETAVRNALDTLRGTKKNNDEDTAVAFRRLVENVATAAYKDAPNDGMRLVHLLARGVEQSHKDYTIGNCLNDIEGKSLRCAQMLKFAFKDKIVDVAKAQKAITDTIKSMVERGLNPKAGDNGARACRQNLERIMYGGRLFTDQIEYDMGHRAGGNAEIALNKSFGVLLKCIEHYGKIDRATFIRDPGQQEVAA